MESERFWNAINRYYTLKREDNEKGNTKCVICHENSRAIFSTVVDENRKLKINCDNKNQCSLEIIIPPFSLLTKELSAQNKIIETLQNKIIEIKNEFIFGYTTEEETVESFQYLKKELNDTITKSQHLFQLLVDIKPDEDKINECKGERNALIAIYKLDISEYKKTRNPQTLEHAINIYKDITVKNKEIMKLSYIYSGVEIIQKNVEHKNVEYKLMQKELTVDSIEIIDLELVKNVGMDKYVQNDTTTKPFQVRKHNHKDDLEEEYNDPEQDADEDDSEEVFKPGNRVRLNVDDSEEEYNDPEQDVEEPKEVFKPGNRVRLVIDSEEEYNDPEEDEDDEPVKRTRLIIHDSED